MISRIRDTLEFGPQVDISLEPSRRFLYRHIDKKVKSVIVIIDIADSTKLSLNINTNLLARIIQLFSQEMSLLINQYGGYVLKYVGDAVIAFFPAEFDEKKACMNAIAVSKEMLKVIDEYINPELEKKNLNIRAKVSINLGSDLIIVYDKRQSYIDIVGSTISVATKILLNAPHSSIIITKSVYEQVDKTLFKDIQLDSMHLYRLDKDQGLKRYLDGKSIVYKIIDEVDIEINNPSLIIKEILKRAIKEGYDKDVYKTIVVALMHFILAKFMIPSERKVEVDNQVLDIIIPSSRVLKEDPNNALILAFPDEEFDIDKLSKLQPNKDNIWLIFGYPTIKQYNYRTYLPDQFAERPLSMIIDDINNFLKKRDLKGFRILPS
jgi:class 3 adenylate cyclase